MCRASLGSVVEGFESMVDGGQRKEAERTMVHGRLVAKAEGGGDLWLARQSCRDGFEALLLIQGRLRWNLETSSMLLAWVLLGFFDFGSVL